MTSGCKEHNLGDGEGTSPHRQCGRCSRKHGCRRRSCGRRFRNPVRAEIHPDLQGDRVGVGFGTAATPAPAGDIRSRSRSRSNGCARWSCCHTWLSRKSRRHDPARAVPSTGAKQPEPTRADAKRPSLGDARTPPTTAVLAGLRLLAARGLLLFLRLCWCGGRLRGAKRFRSLGDTCSFFGFGDSCRCPSTWPQERRQRLERSTRSRGVQKLCFRLTERLGWRVDTFALPQLRRSCVVWSFA